jgi:hypothetical protein
MSDYVAVVEVPVQVALRAERVGRRRISSKNQGARNKRTSAEKSKVESNKRRRQKKKQQRKNVEPSAPVLEGEMEDSRSREASQSEDSTGGGLSGIAAASGASAVPTYAFLKQKLALAEEKLGLFKQQKNKVRAASKAFKKKKKQALKLSKGNPNQLLRSFGSIVQPSTKGMQKGNKIRQSHIRINNKVRSLHQKKHRSWDATFD